MLAERIIRVVGNLVLMLFLVGAVSADEVSRDNLRHGRWQVETPLGTAVGPCLYVEDVADTANWRCEIAVAESGSWPTHDDVLRRHGRGWTLTGGSDGGFMQPWDEPWQQLGASVTRSLVDLLRRWSRGPVLRDDVLGDDEIYRRWRRRPSLSPVTVSFDDWTGLPAAWRPPTSGTPASGALRRRLTARGTGRGGDGVVLNLRWEDERLAVTSARWPGRITIEGVGSETVEVPAEAFLPLWPLVEFLQ